MNRKLPEADFESSRTQAKPQSWDGPNLHSFNKSSHMTLLPEITRVVDVRNWTRQAFDKGSCPFRDCPCQVVNKDLPGRFEKQLLRIVSNCLHLFCLELKIVVTKCGDFIELFHVVVCQLTVPFDAFLRMSFHAGRPRWNVRVHSCFAKQLSKSSCGRQWLEHFSFLVDEILVRLTFTLGASKVDLIQKLRLFLQVNLNYQSFLHSVTLFSFLCWQCINKYFHPGAFSHPWSSRPFQSVVPQTLIPKVSVQIPFQREHKL